MNIIEPFPPMIDACDWCGTFKRVSYIDKHYICYDCTSSLEDSDETLCNNLDN